MTQTFEEYVLDWDGLVARIEAAKKDLKVLTDSEMTIRKAIAESVNKAVGGLKEGVNTIPLGNGRKLKVTHTVKREIDQTMIPAVRETYNLLNDRPVVFDDLLRLKYELDKKSYDKLSDEALKVVSRMVTAKPVAPVVVLD